MLPDARRVRRWVNLLGAVASIGLVAGMGVWGYRLAMLDVTGVPVVKALEGPMRVAPENPGGEIADHQGLAVNGIAEAGMAAPLPERLILAPRPVDLAPEDMAGLAVPDSPLAAGLDGELAAGPAEPGALAPDAASLALAAAPQTESANPTEIAVEAALAEALGLEPPVPVDPVVDDVDLEGVIALSPRPRARPVPDMAAVPTTGPVTPAFGGEIDPATIAIGTRLVQFGAFDSVDEARAEWARLQAGFPDLMAGKDMVLQPAESGGRSFWRLRAHGFDDEAATRRFCAAFLAPEATCIPVPQR